MKKKSMGRLFLYWLRENWFLFLLYLIFAGTVLIVAYLQELPLGALGYGLLIGGFVEICFLLLRFLSDYQNFQKLYLSSANLKYSLQELPKARTQSELLYQEMLCELFEDRGALDGRMKREQTESSDYYTMWIHQIKTPIAAMRLMMQSGELAEKKLLMEQELFQIEQYAEMALHYLRLHNMENDFLFARYDLYDIVKEALKKYSVAFIEKRLSLEFREFHLEVVTDEKWLGFVIGQILSNAVKYTPKGQIAIRLEQISQEQAELVIADTGIGIHEEDLPRIFERGFTGYNGHMDKRSTGIGLYLCRQVVGRLNVTMDVTSKLGVGTSFHLYFETQH